MRWWRILALSFVLAARAGATAYWFDSAPFTTYAEFNPLPLFTGTNSGHTTKELQPSTSLRFASNSDHVTIYSFTSIAAGRTYAVLQDGNVISFFDFPASGGGTWAEYILASGLDTSKDHEYEILCTHPIQNASANWTDGYLELNGDGIAPIHHTQRLYFSFYGDSVTGVTNGIVTTGSAIAIENTQFGTMYSDMWIACQAAGRAMSISGTAGGKVNPTGRDSTANINPAVDQCHVRYGINDMPDLPAGDAAFQAAYTQMIINIRAQITNQSAPIYCYQVQPLAGVTLAQQQHEGALVQAAIAGMANVFYISTVGWYPTTTAYLPDGIHPNGTPCYRVYAANEIPLWRSGGVVVSGSATAGTVTHP